MKLGWATLKQPAPKPGEISWERGERFAGELRAHLGIPHGPLTNGTLEQFLDAKLPLAKSVWRGGRHFRGGFRDDESRGRTAVLVTSSIGDSQRFYLAQLIGAALAAPVDQHVLPVTDAGTALQKFERAFAQALLCPWADLDAFTDESGTDDDGIAEASAYFEVSELLVRSALVNKEKIPRGRLPA